MQLLRLNRMELQVMDAFWNGGVLSIREVQENFKEAERPAYTTVQSIVYRLEQKGAVRRVKKISNAHMFESSVTREEVSRSLLDDVLAFFGGQAQPVVSHLLESGKLTIDEVREAEQQLKKLAAKKRKPKQ